MNDRDALLRAIEANPDEDTPRLAFADWLDETAGGGNKGKEARAWAAYVRSQIELARVPQTDPRFWDWQDRREEERPTPLLALLPTKPRLRRWGVSSNLEFSRGFLDTLRLPAKKFLTVAPELATCPSPLIKLAVLDAESHITNVIEQPVLARFSTLAFIATHLTAASFQLFLNCPYLANLIGLELFSDLETSESTALVTADTFENLRRLSFCPREAASAVIALANSATMTNLEELVINTGEFSPVASRAFGESPRLSRLRAIKNYCGGDDSWLHAVANGGLPALVRLRQRKTLDDTGGFAALLRSPRFRQFEVLEIDDNPISPAIWAAIPSDPGPSGLELNYSPPDEATAEAMVRSSAIGRCSSIEFGYSPGITVAHLALLGASEYARHLRILSIYGRSFGSVSTTQTGKELRPFAESPHLAGLIELRLRGFGLTDVGLDALTRATFASELRSLDVTGRFSGKGIRRLLQRNVFPKLRNLRISLPEDSKMLSTDLRRSSVSPSSTNSQTE